MSCYLTWFLEHSKCCTDIGWAELNFWQRTESPGWRFWGWTWPQMMVRHLPKEKRDALLRRSWWKFHFRILTADTIRMQNVQSSKFSLVLWVLLIKEKKSSSNVLMLLRTSGFKSWWFAFILLKCHQCIFPAQVPATRTWHVGKRLLEAEGLADIILMIKNHKQLSPARGQKENRLSAPRNRGHCVPHIQQ